MLFVSWIMTKYPHSLLDRRVIFFYTMSINRPQAVFKYHDMTLVMRLRDYFIGAIGEMKKVVWPTKKQTITYTLLVITMSVGVAIFFGVLDYLFNLVLEVLI